MVEKITDQDSKLDPTKQTQRKKTSETDAKDSEGRNGNAIKQDNTNTRPMGLDPNATT